jgi:hypothetical protein
MQHKLHDSTAPGMAQTPRIRPALVEHSYYLFVTPGKQKHITQTEDSSNGTNRPIIRTLQDIHDPTHATVADLHLYIILRKITIFETEADHAISRHHLITTQRVKNTDTKILTQKRTATSQPVILDPALTPRTQQLSAYDNFRPLPKFHQPTKMDSQS